MDKFLSESSIHGLKGFHSSEPKSTRNAWLFIYLLSFCGLGFYCHTIYLRCKVTPIVIEEVNQIPMRDLPLPAITICSPRFSGVFIYNFEKIFSTNRNWSVKYQNDFVANMQACDAKVVGNVWKKFPNASSSNVVAILSEKYRDFRYFFNNDKYYRCHLHGIDVSCAKLWYKTLTDNGFCFSFNTESFNTIFNSKIISKDFHFNRSLIARTELNFYKSIDEKTEVDWTLEKGYLNDSDEAHPLRYRFITKIRSIMLKNFHILCPSMGSNFFVYFHMPNEILTPFHHHFQVSKDSKKIFEISAELHRVDESMRPFPPSTRGCFFEGERHLKFFKSYTKFHCEFECMANFTLSSCGCVKFSMPRENKTKICEISEVNCYLKAAEKFGTKSRDCNCFRTCTEIKYKVEDQKQIYGGAWELADVDFDFNQKGALEHVTIATYTYIDALADFGSILGVFFGCSVISIVEIFYFIATSRINTEREESVEEQSSNDGIDHTTHAINFISDKSKKKTVRIAWLIVFFVTSSACLYNAYGNFIRFIIVPEIDVTKSQKSLNEIPFPTVTLCTNFFTKEKIFYYALFNNQVVKNPKMFESISPRDKENLIANMQHQIPENINRVLTKFNKLENFSNPENFRYDFDFLSALNRTQYEISELFTECKVKDKKIECNKILKRVLTFNGICFTFNSQNFHSIFNEEVSDDFESFGKDQREEEVEWTPGEGFKTNKTQVNPLRAAEVAKLSLTMSCSQRTSVNIVHTNSYSIFYHLPNEVISPFQKTLSVDLNTKKLLKLSAKSEKSEEDLRSFSPQNRGCFFEDERKLKFFKTYTRQNCMLECLTNATEKACNCTSFLMPRLNNSKICQSPNEFDCAYNTLKFDFPPKNDSINPCGCLPTCNGVDYKIEWEATSNLKANDYSQFITSKIEFQFSSDSIDEELKFVAYGFKEFATDFGGLLGLFIGCSMVSVAELFCHGILIFWRFYIKFVCGIEEEETVEEPSVDEIEHIRIELEKHEVKDLNPGCIH